MAKVVKKVVLIEQGAREEATGFMDVVFGTKFEAEQEGSMLVVEQLALESTGLKYWEVLLDGKVVAGSSGALWLTLGVGVGSHELSMRCTFSTKGTRVVEVASGEVALVG